jgi:hypothetical protein
VDPYETTYDASATDCYTCCSEPIAPEPVVSEPAIPEPVVEPVAEPVAPAPAPVVESSPAPAQADATRAALYPSEMTIGGPTTDFTVVAPNGAELANPSLLEAPGVVGGPSWGSIVDASGAPVAAPNHAVVGGPIPSDTGSLIFAMLNGQLNNVQFAPSDRRIYNANTLGVELPGARW